jgi:ABC-type nickel/cobalt efflux system permease component RcnA
MRGVLARTTLLAIVAVGVLLMPAAASAHPLGNFTVNTFAGIVLSPGAVRVDYVVDLAEIPTVQAMPELDADGDGSVTAVERAAWASGRARELLDGLTLEIDGEPIALQVSASHAELAPGQGGLAVVRLEASFAGPAPREGALTFVDGNFAGRVGWHEVVASTEDGVALDRSDVPGSSPSDRLRAYPDGLLSSPLDVRAATVTFGPGAGPSTAPADAGPETSGGPRTSDGALAGLLERTGPLMVLALGLAAVFGALHALGPGHGKTLMAAYLVGAGGRVRQAVAVGGAVAVMHTASVLGLGVVVLTATELFAPERVYPWLGLASGLIALGLGASLLVSRLGAWSGRGPHDHDHAGHGHDAAHGAHEHAHRVPDAPPLSRRGLTALAVAGGILPSPTALVVLLGAIAVHRVAYGLALIGAFSLGLAGALVVVGILAIRARDLMSRRMSGRVARVLPLASAAAIAVLGLVLTVSGAARI